MKTCLFSIEDRYRIVIETKKCYKREESNTLKIQTRLPKKAKIMSQVVCFSLPPFTSCFSLIFLHGVNLTDQAMLTCNSFCRG